MRSTAQTPGQSVLEHGESVASHYADIFNHLTEGTPLRYDWRLPSWLETRESRGTLIERLLPLDTVRIYQIYHDCGKPYCLFIDDEGRRHFPNHAACSEAVWRSVSENEPVARLISMDMDIHRLKADGIPEFAERPEAATLLLTGLAEVHSNAAMFGGRDTTSFKSKWKHLDRRGRGIFRQWAASGQKEAA